MAAPIAPTGLAVSQVTSQSVLLSWTDASSDETSFFIGRRFLQAGEWQPWETEAIPGNRTSHTQGGLRPATRYQFRVQGVNASGTGAASNVVEVPTLGLFAKSWVNASAAGQTGIEVQVWRPPISGLGAGEPLHIITGQAFANDLETGPSTGQPEAVMLVALPVPSSLPVLRNGDPVRMYMVGYVGGVETFTRITRDSVIVEKVVQVDDDGGGGDPPGPGPNDPLISGPGTIGMPHQYTPGLRSPISGSWWNVDGMRVYPTDRDFVGTDVDVGGLLQAEDVVLGVSYFSAPITITAQVDAAAEEIAEIKAAGIEAVANAIGTGPQPVSGDSKVWRGENLKRLAGGGLAFVANTSYGPGIAALEVNAQSLVHEFKWTAIAQNAYWLESQFDGLNGAYSLYAGATHDPSGLSVRISRGDNVSAWRVQVIKYTGHGTSPTTEAQIGADGSLPAGMTSVTVGITRNRQTGSCQIVVTPNTGSPVTYSFADASAGLWLIGKMLGNGGTGSPVMEIRGGIGNGAGVLQVPANDRYATIYLRDFRTNQNRATISDKLGSGVEFLDHCRWDPTVINDEAQVFVKGSDYRGYYESPSPTKIGGDPFQFVPSGLKIKSTEAPLAERPYLNPVPVHTYATHADRVALNGFAPSVTQREQYKRVRVAADNSYWYMYPPGSSKAGQWRECGSRWYSGALTQRGIFDAKYCALRIRFTGSLGPGIWLAGWWLPASKVESCEIDPFETASTSAANRGGIHFNTHLPDFVRRLYSSWETQQPSGIKQFPAGGDITHEHCVECDWQYDRIRWYLDGRLVHASRNVAFEEMVLHLTQSIANGNEGFQERFDASTPNPVEFVIHSIHMLQRPSARAHGPVQLSRPVIRDNGNGSAVVSAAGIAAGSVPASLVKYWRQYLFPRDDVIGSTYWYSSSDEGQLVSYVEEHRDAAGKLTVISSEPLFVQGGVGRQVYGGQAPEVPWVPPTTSNSGYTDFDFSRGVEPPGADVSNPERFVTSSGYEAGVVIGAPAVAFTTNWTTLGTAPSLTSNYAAAPDGTTRAARMVLAAGLENSGIRYAVSGRTPSVHTNQVWLKSNNGSNQSLYIRSLVTGNYQAVTVTNEWQRFTTLGSLTTDWFSHDLASTGGAVDVLVFGMDFYTGDRTQSVGTGGQSYLDLMPGHSIALDVTPGDYNMQVTKADGSTETTPGHVLASGVSYDLAATAMQVRRIRFVPTDGTTYVPERPAGFAEGDNLAPPPGIVSASSAMSVTCAKWGEVPKGSCLAVNDQWNVTNWGLDGTISQCVYLGDQTTQGANTMRLTSTVPRNWPWPGGGSPNTGVKAYPRAGWGQSPGDINRGHVNLPIRVGDINVLWTGHKSINDSSTAGHGHLSHDMRLMDTAQVFQGYDAAAPHIRQELFVVIKQYESYGAVANRTPSWYHGQYTIGGHDWHFFIQPGATTDPAGNPNPQLIWIPVSFPLPNPLDMAPLFRWAMRTKYSELKLNAPGRVAWGRSANDTVIDPNLIFVSDAIGVEVDEGKFDVTVDTAFFRVNQDTYTPSP